MRFANIAMLIAVFATTAARAQTENIDPPRSATPVVIEQKPPTALDVLDQSEGLLVKGLSLAGTLNDDRGGSLEIYAVTSRIEGTSPGEARGLALVVRNKDGTAARAYVDEAGIEKLIEAVKKLAAMDRGSSPMQETRGVYRAGNLAVLNVDDNGGRVAIVRALTVSPITNEASIAVARFRANRLNELERYLQTAKKSLDKQK